MNLLLADARYDAIELTLMTIHCSNCATRLQLDDTKIPARRFTIKCPKCQTPISAQPPAYTTQVSGGHAMSCNGDGREAHEPSRFETATPAPVYEVDNGKTTEPAGNSGSNDGGGAATSETSELVRLLAALLQRGVPAQETQRNSSRLAWERRRALVCVAGNLREAVAGSLAEHDYQTFVADDLTQALERMREERMHVVILDPDFDPVEQGAAFISREVSVLRPAERRRLFFVRLHASARTGDTHAAFIHNVNLVVNPADIEKLPRAMERAMRDYNDLYSEFHRAINVAAI
ncbi:MAG: zinc-ribbon domain-containing protein [Pyrinomonadaceae bacterium]